MSRIEALDRLARAVPESKGIEGYRPGGLPGLGFIAFTSPTPLEGTVYEPVVCLILRGRKRTTAGSTTVDFGPGESLIVSHSLPVVSQVTECPYLALTLALDVGVLRGLMQEVTAAAPSADRPECLGVDYADEELIDALERYVRLVGRPAAESQVLAPLVFKEIHFRLLLARHGGMLRALLHVDSNASHIHRAIAEIRRDFRSTLSVPRLATRIGMSESAFHRHFKAITGRSPLQYQKVMRLQEAHRLISAEAYSVSRAASEVGYGSPTQFSREFSREFGTPPSRVSALG